jgi:bacterioferritin (cytochrome b1)
MSETLISDKQAVVELLNADLRDEHAAIIQYLQHAYAIGEGEEAGEIEAIAREEMRHFDWLAEAIVELGGKPDMERGEVDLTGSGPVEWMARDILAEERAIAQYKGTLPPSRTRESGDFYGASSPTRNPTGTTSPIWRTNWPKRAQKPRGRWRAGRPRRRHPLWWTSSRPACSTSTP